jgi:hypothetical protein
LAMFLQCFPDRTSNPVCRLLKAVGGFDSHALPPGVFEDGGQAVDSGRSHYPGHPDASANPEAIYPKEKEFRAYGTATDFVRCFEFLPRPPLIHTKIPIIVINTYTGTGHPRHSPNLLSHPDLVHDWFPVAGFEVGWSRRLE